MKPRGISNNIKNLVLLIVFGIVAFILLFKLYQSFHQAELDNRQLHLQRALDVTIIEFQDEMEKFALLCTSLRSHILSVGYIPDKVEMQKHIINQLKYSDYAHSLVVNYVDTNLNVIYSISESSLESNVGEDFNLSMIPHQAIKNRLAKALSTNELVAFPPVNLVRGFVGIAMSFKVVIEGKNLGFIASSIDIKNILNPIFEKDVDKEFTYRFSFDEDIVFDRERVFSASPANHDRFDSENMNYLKKDYLTNQMKSYGLTFDIGIAYKDLSAIDFLVPFIETSWVIVFAMLGLLLLLSFVLMQLVFRSNELKTSLNQISTLNTVLIKFQSAISSELKPPLGKIKNLLSFFLNKNKKLLSGEGKSQLKEISSTVEQLNLLMDDFLTYTDAIDSTKIKEQVSLNDIIEDIKGMFLVDRIKILNEPLPNIIGDKSQLYKLFQNLISNAVKFNESEQVSIIVSSQMINDHVEIRVSDNGIGVKPEHLESIFLDFRRRNKDQYPGTGLGLPLCKEIVRNHGGEIRAEINAQGGLDVIFQLEIKEEL